ncbi:hypothetical protein BLGI_3348 [Brevibacillus laterosporus GI-9]|nr:MULTISPECIES: hypothetical protein [Brevibacillus]MCR8966205.1 hypothetical protein [Brevibacillus laterosporus]MCZ0838362.1 hypothetical protein [Brevibacillus halotolerans]CCF15406.1 hypothetical protein BLGI_3348 [Brevibacillus laterosporus GI-9]
MGHKVLWVDNLARVLVVGVNQDEVAVEPEMVHNSDYKTTKLLLLI